MTQQENNLQPSRRLRSIHILESINVYGLFFGAGVAAANISRLFPYGGAVYAGIMVSMIGLSFLKAEVDVQKLIILGSGLSAIAFWDAISQWFFQPILIGDWIIPLWQCLAYGISFLMILIGVASVLKENN